MAELKLTTLYHDCATQSEVSELSCFHKFRRQNLRFFSGKSNISYFCSHSTRKIMFFRFPRLFDASFWTKIWTTQRGVVFFIGRFFFSCMNNILILNLTFLKFFNVYVPILILLSAFINNIIQNNQKIWVLILYKSVCHKNIKKCRLIEFYVSCFIY